MRPLRDLLRAIPLGSLQRTFNFGSGERKCLAFSWPDVITGQQTTGVADIEAYLEAPAPFRLAWQAGAQAADLHGESYVRAALSPLSALWPERPSAAPARAMISVVVEAVDPWRRTTRFGLKTLDGSLTNATALRRSWRACSAGEHRPVSRHPPAYGPGIWSGAWRLRGALCLSGPRVRTRLFGRRGWRREATAPRSYDLVKRLAGGAISSGPPGWARRTATDNPAAQRRRTDPPGGRAQLRSRRIAPSAAIMESGIHAPAASRR